MKLLLQHAMELLRRGEAVFQPDRALNHATTAFILDRLYFGEFQIYEQLSSAPIGERINILGRRGPSSGAPLWLVAQTGAGLPPIPASWQSLEGQPTEARRATGRNDLLGFGAQSGKLDLLLKIMAASNIPASELGRPVHIAAISGEEGLGSGGPTLLGPLDMGRGTALVHGPTSNTIWTRHPGCLALHLRVERRLRHRRMPPHTGLWQFTYETDSAHGLSTRHSDDPDALTVAMRILDALRASGEVRVLEFSAGEAANRRPARCLIRAALGYAAPPNLKHIHPRIQVTALADTVGLPMPIDNMVTAWFRAEAAGLKATLDRAGLARNAPEVRPARGHMTGRVVADRDYMSGDIVIWTGPGVDHEDLCVRFANATQQAIQDEAELEVELHVLQDRPALETSEGSEELVATAAGAMKECGLAPIVGGGLATTDAGLFRFLGVESLVFGAAGPLDTLYRDDESISIEALERALGFYEAMIRRLAGRT